MGTWVDGQRIKYEQQMCLLRAVFPGRSIKTGSSWDSTPVFLFCLKTCWRLSSQTWGRGLYNCHPIPVGGRKVWLQGAQGRLPRGCGGKKWCQHLFSVKAAGRSEFRHKVDPHGFVYVSPPYSWEVVKNPFYDTHVAMVSFEEKMGNVKNIDNCPGIFSLGNEKFCLHGI